MFTKVNRRQFTNRKSHQYTINNSVKSYESNDNDNENINLICYHQYCKIHLCVTEVECCFFLILLLVSVCWAWLLLLVACWQRWTGKRCTEEWVRSKHAAACSLLTFYFLFFWKEENIFLSWLGQLKVSMTVILSFSHNFPEIALCVLA